MATVTSELTSDNKLRGEFMELTRDAPPTHFSFTIQSFSLLSKASLETYETNSFEAGGYKWKLCLYPTGNKSRNIQDHISLYLVMADTDSLNPCWNVSVVFRFLLFDHIQDKYLTVKDCNLTTRRFHARKKEWGFDQFIALDTFNDPSNGYLVDDVAVFGAEVFVCNENCRRKEERLSMIKGAVATKHFWKIENFSEIDEEFLESEAFMAGHHTWKIRLFPQGLGEGEGTHLSLYLVLADDDPPQAAFPRTLKVYVDFTLRIKNLTERKEYSYDKYGRQLVSHRIDGRYIENKVNRWFSPGNKEGWPKFGLLSYLTEEGFLFKDNCNVEAEVTALGVAT